MYAFRQTSSTIQLDRGFDMPSIPLVLTKIIQVLDDDSTTSQQLEELILHDPSLSARILKLANSAFYSFRAEVRTLSHAVSLLGMGLVKSLAIGVSIFESFMKGSKSEADLINKLWMHSFGTGLLTQEIWSRRAATKKDIEFAFLCGLLHDLGKVVFFKKDPRHYSAVFKRQKSDQDPDLTALETQSFGVDHAYVGAILAKQWGFPPELVTVIRKHHAGADPKTPLAAVVCLGDLLAKQAGIGFDGDNRVRPEFKNLLVQLAIGPDELGGISDFALKKRQEIEQFFQTAI
jgi:putative nucleotidyltransferase with HDIG domain